MQKGGKDMRIRLTKKLTAMCLALGMTLMPMGQAFANEEGQNFAETASAQQDEVPEMMGESEVTSEVESAAEVENVVDTSQDAKEEMETWQSEETKAPAETETKIPEETTDAQDEITAATESSESSEAQSSEPQRSDLEQIPTQETESTEAETIETETSEESTKAEEVIECEEDTVSEGTFYNERDSLSQEERERIQEEISQIERPENYLEGNFTNYSECTSYVRNQMSLRYNYVMFNLYSSKYRSLSAMETMNNTIFNNAFAHTGISYQGDAILYDYEGIDWQVTRYALGNGQYCYSFIYTIVYKDTTQQELELRSAIQNKTAELCNGVSSDYEKIRRIYDFICSTVSYDYTNLYDYNHRLKYTAYAAMFHHTAVCQGYATLFYRMCEEVGISSRVITSIDHAWNIVQIGNRYYNVDSTWDAYASPVERNYQYFLKSNAEFPGHEREYEFTTYSFNASYPMTESSYSVPKEHRTFVGLYCTDGIWYYYENGEVNSDFTDLVFYNGTWYYVENGVLNWNYTGLALHEGIWYQVKKGCVDWNYTGLSPIPDSQRWCYIEKGVHNQKYTGLVYYNKIWYYVQNGVLDWNYTGLTLYNGTWYYVYKSSINWNYTGLTLYKKSWYYVRKGCVDWNYTGLTQYYGTWYYVKKGCLNWGYSGLTRYNGTWYYIDHGVLNWKYTGLTYYVDCWYYVENGILTWNYTGVIPYYGTWYYVKNSTINWGYNGTFTQNGHRYQIRYGRVVG